jgi:superfamily II RNA helicase
MEHQISTQFPLHQLLPQGEEPSSDQILDQFLTYTAQKGLILYPAQEEAILALYEGQNVILNTPTGSGKSLVATALHFQSLALGRRSYYTCPIKALVNEKFLALCQDFGPDRVGMITGDASINPDAPIICCTAEILSNLALREGKNTGVHDVIMDEFHYYSDRERGVAWQIPLLTMPHTRFMLMSATLGSMQFFEEGLKKLNGRDVVVIKTMERPVPLTFRYQETPLHETIQDLMITGKSPVYLVNFTQRDCAEEAQNLMSIELCTKEEKKLISDAVAEFGIRFSSPYGKDILRMVKHGVGIHHAGLLPKYRLLVERLAQRGLLKVISGTDTLGVGVNVPIRSVLFTKLCKFDGEKTSILSVRDFRQISGRAGRKGYDNEGLVVVQAPEHVVENKRMEQKAGDDPKKRRKLVRKNPPEKGFVMWTKDTFDKLLTSEPEPLQSQFQVSHGMILNVLSRHGDGCRDMRGIVNACHDSPHNKERHRKVAFQMFRSLVDRKIIEFTDKDPETSRRGVRVHVDLQEDFSIHHALALYLIDTVKLVDPYSDTYALDILTLAESIVENPDLILKKQLDSLKSEKMYEMKMEGLEYEERIAELEKLEYPKPNREFIYGTFNEFAAKHPWISQENIKPKSIVREMFEGFMTFDEYVREYDIQRSEGLLLRYISEVYKVLVQTVPATCKDDIMNEIIEYVGVIARQVDATLLDEWEKMKGGGRSPAPQGAAAAALTSEEYDITRNKKSFAVAIRNEVFQYIKALSQERFQNVVDLCKASDPGHQWTVDHLRDLLAQYRSDHVGPLTDRRARAGALFSLSEGKDVLVCQQVVADEDNHNDWMLEFTCDVAASRAEGRPVLKLKEFRTIV